MLLLIDYRVLSRSIMEMHARTGHVVAQAESAETAARKAQQGGPAKAAKAEELTGKAERLRDVAQRALADNSTSVEELRVQRLSDFKQALVVYAVTSMENAVAEMQMWSTTLDAVRALQGSLLAGESEAEAEAAGGREAEAAAEAGSEAVDGEPETAGVQLSF